MRSWAVVARRVISSRSLTLKLRKSREPSSVLKVRLISMLEKPPFGELFFQTVALTPPRSRSVSMGLF